MTLQIRLLERVMRLPRDRRRRCCDHRLDAAAGATQRRLVLQIAGEDFAAEFSQALDFFSVRSLSHERADVFVTFAKPAANLAAQESCRSDDEIHRPSYAAAAAGTCTASR